MDVKRRWQYEMKLPPNRTIEGIAVSCLLSPQAKLRTTNVSHDIDQPFLLQEQQLVLDDIDAHGATNRFESSSRRCLQVT